MANITENKDGYLAAHDTLIVTIVDDDDSVRTATKRLLRSSGFEVATFPTAEEFLESSRLYDTNCLVLDLELPRMSGLELQSHLAANDHRIPIIFVTGSNRETHRWVAMKAGAIECLEKPFSDEALLKCIRTALKA